MAYKFKVGDLIELVEDFSLSHTKGNEFKVVPKEQMCTKGIWIEQGQVTIDELNKHYSSYFTFAGTPAKKHNHYFKDCPYDKIDVYRILDLWKVSDPCLQHLVKKALCAGERGHKDFRRDLQDIIDTAQRRIDMLDEDKSFNE